MAYWGAVAQKTNSLNELHTFEATSVNSKVVSLHTVQQAYVWVVL